MSTPGKDSLWRTLLGVGLVTGILYGAFFFGIEWWRARKGPWVAAFNVSADGRPVLTVAQPRLGINQVTLVFAEETAAPTNAIVRFDRPVKSVPWGSVVYQDPISFPGVVTLHLFGHEVELMPRTLSLNRREVPWRAEGTNVMKSADKLPPDQLVRKKYEREVKAP